MAEVRGSGLGSVTVSGLWNMKRPNKNETSRFQEILTMQQIRHQGDHFKSKAVCLERTKGIKKKRDGHQIVPDWSRQGGRSSACTLSPSLPG